MTLPTIQCGFSGRKFKREGQEETHLVKASVRAVRRSISLILDAVLLICLELNKRNRCVTVFV